MHQRTSIESKKRLLSAFNANFTLSKEDVATLTMSSEPVDDRFFTVLVQAKEMSKKCEVLLGFENQTVGRESMEQVSRHLNLAFQKLYRWVQRELKTLNLENPRIDASIRRALWVLAERPTLFQNCMDFFAEARDHTLSESFQTALTGSSTPDGGNFSVKPIDLAAHDPLRYVGDMLAWMHSAAVGEREALESLFVSDGDEIARGLQAGRGAEVWRLLEEDDEPAEFDPVAALNELVDRDMSGAARAFRQRVEQVMQNNEDSVLAHKLANLLGFYKDTFSRFLADGSVLLESLERLEDEAKRQFRSLLRDHVAALQAEPRQPPTDLTAPAFLQEALEELRPVLATYETSLAAVSKPSLEEEELVLAEAFDPVMALCENMAQATTPPLDSVFLVNCLQMAKTALSPFGFAAKRVDRLQINMGERVSILEDSQYLYFRMASGLDPLVQALGPLLETREEGKKVGQLPALQVPSLSQARATLDNFLPSALVDAMENLRELQDSKLARSITEKAAERFCADFEHIEQMLILADEVTEGRTHDTGTPRFRDLFPRTLAEIRVLLS